VLNYNDTRITTVYVVCIAYTGWAKKWATDSWPKKITGKFLGKFVVKVKLILTLPQHLAYVATLPCETLISVEQAIDEN